jgi:hypothetical protein
VRSSVTLVSLPLETLLITRRQYNTQGYPVRELGLASRYANLWSHLGCFCLPRVALPTARRQQPSRSSRPWRSVSRARRARTGGLNTLWRPAYIHPIAGRNCPKSPDWSRADVSELDETARRSPISGL